MELDKNQKVIVRKIGNFTAEESRSGLKRSQIQFGSNKSGDSNISKLMNEGVLERVEDGRPPGRTEHRYRLTDKGWEVYHEGY